MMKVRSGISRAWNLEETPWTQELKKNMKIPRKKNKNNQSLYQESQDYRPNMNSLKAIKQKNRKW
jgi:hypothetical protein